MNARSGSLLRRESRMDATATSEPTRSGAKRLVAVIVAVLLLGGAIGWALGAVFVPPSDVLDSQEFTYVEVVEGEVGSSIQLNTVAQWTPSPAGSNLSQGVVTSVAVSPGQEVASGETLYSVNLRPVVIAQGDIPAFRGLSYGTSGADVAQLQSLLISLGLLSGSADGSFGSGTERAVRAWQRSLGITPDGVVLAGDIVFVASMPARVSLDVETIRRGVTVAGGEEVIRVLPAEPSFTIPITDSQAALMTLGMRVEIDAPGGGTWEAAVAGQIPADDDSTRAIVLEGLNGGSICESECASVSPGDRSLLASLIVTEESVSGLVVPTAALRADSAGSLSVVDDQGEEHSVTLVAAADGMAVVTGVNPGTRVRIPAGLT